MPFSLMIQSAQLKLLGDEKDHDLYPTVHVYQQPLRVGRPRHQGSARFCLPGLTVVFDLSMDPCLKYSLPMVADSYEVFSDEEQEEEEKKKKPSKAKTKNKNKKSTADGKSDNVDGGEATAMDTDATSPTESAGETNNDAEQDES